MRYYCKKCKFNFDDKFAKKNDTNNILCPKCNDIVNLTAKRMTPVITKGDMVASKILNIYLSIYSILSVLALVCFLFKLNTILIVLAIIMSLIFAIELLFGFTRNYFGLVGYTIAVALGMSFIKEPLLGFAVGASGMFLLASIIRLIIRVIIKFLYKHFG